MNEPAQDGETRTEPRVVIIGGGMSGIGMAVALKQAGFQRFTILEKAERVGGTWRDNTYPGIACDVPSAYYSYSFAPNPGWSRIFAPGPEIWAYFEQIAGEHDLGSHTRFGATVDAAEWRDDHWHVELASGETVEAEVLVAATGVVHHPRQPTFEGLESFEGPVFHSARWDHGVPLDGRRIGLIGNGSTGAQITTALSGRARPLTVFLRTPQWVLSLPNPRIPRPVRSIFARHPSSLRAYRRLVQLWMHHTFGAAALRPGLRRSVVNWACRSNLRTVKDPVLRQKLTPDFAPMCRRLILAPGFYQAIQHPDVDLVTDAIVRVEPRGVRTGDGRLHELDALVLATGFDPHAFMRPIRMTGLDGRTLDEEWADGAHAYRSVALPGFPNFFMLLGPHSPFGNDSQITVAETQITYIMRWLQRQRTIGPQIAAPRADATARFNQEIKDALSVPGTVWTSGCTSWYLGKDGLPELWPWSALDHQHMLAEIRDTEWETQPAGVAAS